MGSRSSSSTVSVCAQIGGGGANTVNAFATDYRVDARFANTTLRFPGYGGGAQDLTAVKAFPNEVRLHDGG